MVDRYTQIAADSNFIFVFGGTNDWGHNIPLGTYGSKNKKNFYGAVNVLMRGLKKEYPNALIVFGTPIKRLSRGGKYVGVTAKNDNGNKLTDYVGAIKRVAKDYDIPVIDMYHAKECDFTSDLNYHTYWEDGLHPNATAHKQMASYLYKQIKSMIDQ